MKPIHVLVVEDDADIREMLSLVLEVGECRVTQAADGREAMQLLGQNELPSLVLLDLMMPQLSGCEVLSLIRHDPRLRQLPVLVVSGGGDAHRLAMRSGADACLEKPVDARTLLELTRELARQERSERQ